MSSTVARTTNKKFTTKKLPALRIVDSEKTTKKKTSKISNDVILDYVYNAYKGEKKTEAGIKYWFEQHVPGHHTEDSKKQGAPDGYTPGWLVLELKGKQEDWIEGVFQGLARRELSFQKLVVVAHNFLLVFPGPQTEVKGWSKDKKSEWLNLVKIAHSTKGSPSSVGKILAKAYRKKGHILMSYALFRWSPQGESELIPASQSEEEAVASFKHTVTSIDKSLARIEITPKNFSSTLKSLLPFFDDSLDKKFEVVHGFFRCMSYWNASHSPLISDDPAEKDRVYLGAGYFEGLIPSTRRDFIQVVQNYEVRSPDKARFYAHYDKAIDAVDSKYRKNHGIYFTNEYLARLAITMSEKFLGSIAEKYIVFDPACGSGNLVTSWNHHLDLRHKVVSEISPILLKAFELRFQGKSSEQKRGFTIIPKTASGEGLNFVDRAASDYLEKINDDLKKTKHKLNKPLAVICNPPYRNQKNIKDEYYKYDVHESLVEIAGKDASNDLFVAFLAQITEICRLAEEGSFPENSVVLLFTHSGWLSGKKSYSKICDHFLSRFQEKMGFIVNSTEFFEGTEEWPLVVSLWQHQPSADLDSKREIKFQNLMSLKRSQLKELVGDTAQDFDDLSKWGTDEVFRAKLAKLTKSVQGSPIIFNKPVDKIKNHIPPQNGEGNVEISSELIEMEAASGGLCFSSDEQESERYEKFKERVLPIYEKNQQLKKEGKKTKKLPSFKVPGHPKGENVGFTDGKQPYRTNKPYQNNGERLFFLMDTRFIKMQTSQCLSGLSTTRGHVIEGVSEKEKNLIIAYAMAQALTGNYPVQYNQFDMWMPSLAKENHDKLFELAAAFLFASNSCIECEIPAHYPVDDAPRIFVTNPLSPNKGTFWSLHLKKVCAESDQTLVKDVVSAVNTLYSEWKKWIQNNSEYEARAPLPLYSHEQNKRPLDGWGLFQIDHELRQIKDENRLHILNEKRKALVKNLKTEICRFLKEDANYWG